ncbi:hypothetical protein H6F46_13515 [Limnothrix sp. FACHB-1083]|uniref:hypothetical protein n=2 Tax=unclassified Limnothrix TaxID=2632864 RepID=UPI0016809E78|nr:hypothetical protein [Limnothrix sp. FACHB-1083]MBD2161712.1 hypothetical protein [Limnothrix sp. FACHB-1083]MBD2192711.1 hypothetical protein [Limnothrix sp. FACHB-1088]
MAMSTMSGMVKDGGEVQVRGNAEPLGPKVAAKSQSSYRRSPDRLAVGNFGVLIPPIGHGWPAPLSLGDGSHPQTAEQG